MGLEGKEEEEEEEKGKEKGKGGGKRSSGCLLLLPSSFPRRAILPAWVGQTGAQGKNRFFGVSISLSSTLLHKSKVE